jgi:exonuclease SbcD
VVIVDFDGTRVKDIERRRVPRTIEMLSVREGHRPLDEVTEALRSLAATWPNTIDPIRRPLLEVKVLLESANPRVRLEIERGLENAGVRLVRIDARFEHPTSANEADQPESPRGRLENATPLRLFEACFRKTRGVEAPEDLTRMFLELVEEIEQTGRIEGAR